MNKGYKICMKAFFQYVPFYLQFLGEFDLSFAPQSHTFVLAFLACSGFDHSFNQ